MAQLIQMRWLDFFHIAYLKRELVRPVEYFHAHDGIEFLYIHEGTGQLILNDHFYRIEPPMLIFYQPFQLHFFNMNVPYSRSILKIRLPFDERFGHLFPSLDKFMSTLVDQKMDNQVFRLSEEQDADLLNQFRLFNETLSMAPDHERRENFFCFLPQFLAYFKTRIFPIQNATEHTFHPRATRHVEQVMKWIEVHFNHSFHLDKLATEVHLSPSYLSRLFRKYTGNTITEYIGKRRLEEACILLRTSSLSIGQIAEASGFSDDAYFCRSFKKKYGSTPNQYRVLHN